MMESDKPRRRFVLTAELAADSREDLLRELAHLRYLVAADKLGASNVSGGPSGGSIASLSVDETVTHESYFAAVEDHLANLDAERRTETEAAPLDLPALERLDKAATPGPWHAEEGTPHVSADWFAGKRVRLATVHAPEWHENALCGGREAYANAALIAAVRTALPALIERARVAEKLAEELSLVHPFLGDAPTLDYKADLVLSWLAITAERVRSVLADARSAGLLPKESERE